MSYGILLASFTFKHLTSSLFHLIVSFLFPYTQVLLQTFLALYFFIVQKLILPTTN